MYRLNEIFKNFEAAHYKFHGLCEADGSESDVERSQEYFDEIKRTVSYCQSSANTFIESVSLENEINPEDSVSQAESRSSRTKSNASSRSSVKLKVAVAEEEAKRKALELQLKLIEQNRILEQRSMEMKIEQLRLNQEKEELKVKSLLEQSIARQKVLTEYEEQKSDRSILSEKNKDSDVNSLYQYSRNQKPSHIPMHGTPKPLKIENYDFVNPTSTEEEQGKKLIETFTSLTLPSIEVPVFSGDPIDYTQFITAFENLIESKTQNNSTRLYYLTQYTRGDAKNLVSSYLHNPQDGYMEAKEALAKFYGQPYHIATSYVDKIANGAPIRSEDIVGLRRFSILLQSCQNALQKIGYLNKVENPDCLRKIIKRLPFHMKKRWRMKADQIFENEGSREIVFDDIVKFIAKEVRAASHPIFGDLTQDERHKKSQKPSHKPNFGKSFAATSEGKQDVTSPNKSNRQCVLCQKDHRLNECSEFKLKTYEDRVKIVKDKGLCFNCLIPYHMVKQCKKRPACTHCNRKHDTLLHSPAYVSVQAKLDENQQNKDCNSNYTAGNNGGIRRNVKYKIGLPIVPVKVKAKGGDKTAITLAFLDNGSNTTFCTEKLMNDLCLSGKRTTLRLTTLDKEASPILTEMIDLEVYDLEENVFFNLNTVFTRPTLPVTRHDAANQEDVNRWPHLAGVTIPTLETSVDLLIGNDHNKVLEPNEVIRAANGGPYAIKTALGWVLNGPLSQQDYKEIKTSNFIRSDEHLSDIFTKFCNLEFNDCIADKQTEMSQEDKKALNIMEKSVRLKDGHYEIELPLRQKNLNLPNNRSLAVHSLFQKYNEFMKNLISKEYAEKIPPDEINRQDGLVWYLPHHPVVHPQKPGKVRVVFDCSAEHEGVSLNSNLLQGPDLTNTLLGVLLRFRQGNIAVMADIEAMFHQVHVVCNHRDLLRFIWWPSGDFEGPAEEYRMRVHLFGAASSPSCCNFALKQTAKDNTTGFDKDVLDTVRQNFYVDDCLKSLDSVEEAIDKGNQLRHLLSLGGFRLTKWVSNSREVIHSIPESERATTVKLLSMEELPVERALGMKWNTETDRFEFGIAIKDRPATRRGILSVVSSIYDPLGLVAPFVLPAKVLLQDLCRMKLGWDDAVPNENILKWKQWLVELPRLAEYSVSRCIKPAHFDQIVCSQLHHFSDAAETGYGAVSYLRQVDVLGEIHCTLMMAKSRVTPLKQISIPRLELSAALVSTRLDYMIRKELTITLDDSVF